MAAIPPTAATSEETKYGPIAITPLPPVRTATSIVHPAIKIYVPVAEFKTPLTI